MDDARLGRLVRVLRQRRGWRQSDLATRAGLGRTVVADLEGGRVEQMRVATIRRIVAAFGLSSEVMLRGLGADVDRVLDQAHAVLLGMCAKWLGSLGWRTVAEVSYSEWGERGSIDLLAWHDETRTLLVIEIKSELASVEATLRKHDEKVRLAATVARARFGWRAAGVSRLLVLPDTRAERCRVSAHDAVLGGAYPIRSFAARRWCKSPVGTTDGLIFMTNVATRRRMDTGGRRLRVRTTPMSTTEHEPARRRPQQVPSSRQVRGSASGGDI